jgi:carbonic anhydrase
MMKIYLWTFILLSASASIFAQEVETSSDRALKKLMVGNERYRSGKLLHPNISDCRREEVATGQEPFAVIVSCSDSRVPPELIFDRGLGDTFVVRVAGNVVGPLELESVKYAVAALGAPLILVLGHEKCGAVNATLQGGSQAKSIALIAALIEPIIPKAKTLPGDVLSNAIKLNAKSVRDLLRKELLLSKYIQEGQLKIDAAYYDLVDGKVSLLQ